MNYTINAFFDRITGSDIVGWAWIPDSRGEKITVSLINNKGESIETTMADGYRKDLVNDLGKENKVGFSFSGKLLGIKIILFTAREGSYSLSIPLDIPEVNFEKLKINQEDHIFWYCLSIYSVLEGVEYYFKDGQDCANHLKKIVLEENRKEDQKLSLLEFASGFGRVTRFIDEELFDVTASDIHPLAMDFIQDEFGIKTILSTEEPKDYPTKAKYDVVFALSFFSHTNRKLFEEWIKVLFDLLKPNGRLIFSTHGKISNEMVIKLNLKDGFGFRSESEQSDLEKEKYGTAVTLYEYVSDVCQKVLKTDQIEFKEAYWWGHQDLYIVKK